MDLPKNLAAQGNLTELEKNMSAEQMGKEIIRLLKSIDKRLRDWDIPARLTQVENEVFKLKLRR